MKNILIILNHQPKIPPFMLTTLKCAKDRYDEVYYVNTKFPQFAENFKDDENIYFLQPTSLERKFAILRALLSFFKPITSKNVLRCVKDKGIKLKIIKTFLSGLCADECIRPKAAKVIRQSKDDNVTVLSTWLSACAFSAAQLKKKYDTIKSVSMAHSYEILPSRNPLVRYQYVDFKHQYLDGIYFIAHTVYQMYLDGVGPLPKEYKDKMHVCYLGSYKTFPNLNNPQAGILNICTCSRVIPLKRLGLLIAALENWDYCKLHWTHMGNGSIFDDIKLKAEELMAKNPYVEIDLKGFVPNSDVEEYYSKNPVDVFVNLSIIEGLPISIMEAISYGIPVIATDVGGTKEIVTPQVGRLLSANITPNLVKQALCDFCTKPEEERLAMRVSAYNFWNLHFDAKKNINRLFNEIACRK